MLLMEREDYFCRIALLKTHGGIVVDDCPCIDRAKILDENCVDKTSKMTKLVIFMIPPSILVTIGPRCAHAVPTPCPRAKILKNTGFFALCFRSLRGVSVESPKSLRLRYGNEMLGSGQNAGF